MLDDWRQALPRNRNPSMLELRIPPLLLTALFAVAMAVAHLAVPSLSFAFPGLTGAGVFLSVVGAVVCIWGVVAFRRARTTVDPTRPEKASSLVRDGIYRFTRNPMYLGFLLLLGGLALLLGNWLALFVSIAFVPYMNRFQIEPEERALASIFGTEFERFRREVRRWL